MRYVLRCWMLGCVLVGCGSDDGGGGGGSGGSGGATGGSAGSGATSTGGSAGSTGGTSSGGAAGSAVGGAAGGAALCSATTNPYEPSSIDCEAACDHFGAWGTSGACANPYSENHTECALACDTIKGSMPYVNVLYGCAAEHADCNAYLACRADKC